MLQTQALENHGPLVMLLHVQRLRLSLMAMRAEMGYPSALTAPKWGFYDVSFNGKSFEMQRPYGTYVMENILFKISFPAEFHAQTAVECAIKLHDQVKNRLDQIDKITIKTQEPAIELLAKKALFIIPQIVIIAFNT